MRTERFQRVIIRTPEGIEFSLQPAGPIPRCIAWVVDIFCISVLTMILGKLIGLIALFSEGLGMALKIVSFFVVQVGYGMFFEWFFKGQTLGKRLMRLRVVDVQGLRLRPDQVVLRNLLRIADMLPGPYMVGGLVSWFNRRGQRLGDLAANTMVIRQPKVLEPNLDQLLAGKFNSLKEYPHLAARLRQRISPKEASISLQALLRREEMEPQARIALFDELAAQLQTLTEFPPEAVEGLTAEQYVRNVVDVVYRPAVSSAGKQTPAKATVG
jgi:uncharacterized RDD family membrane protein YckC